VVAPHLGHSAKFRYAAASCTNSENAPCRLCSLESLASKDYAVMDGR